MGLSLQEIPYKKQEALWRKACSETHKIWCDCGKWWEHTPGWRFMQGGDIAAITGGRNAVTSTGEGDGGPAENGDATIITGEDTR
ncbi:hypothetical protein [Upsilontorquevirus viver2]|nr:hypothetical protein QKL49_gp2 [Paguma larvata torque teno virus]BBE36945.1 hypothetical protein [Paguma larvata torque teno virus]BBE36948.1 hypothetical protein [Paguma larvata torque teno virus]